MGHPPPSPAEWRRSLAALGLTRPARHFGAWISYRPVAGRPGLYRAGQRPAMRELGYGRRTIARAQGELVDSGLLRVVERGIASRPVSVVELVLPTVSNVPPWHVAMCQ